jgi:hypothetical protein
MALRLPMLSIVIQNQGDPAVPHSPDIRCNRGRKRPCSLAGDPPAGDKESIPTWHRLTATNL